MDSYTFDLQRIFFGDLPLTFIFEIMLRTTILLVYTFALLRFVGHRGLSQLSVAEFVLILGLGSAVGDPMFQPDVPLIHGMIVVAIVVGFQRFVTALTVRSRSFSTILEGVSHRIVVDGMFDLKGIEAARLSDREIFAELRQSGTEHLGQIRRAYLELDGEVSVLKYAEDEERPGLSFMWDQHVPHDKIMCSGSEVEQGHYACCNCGFTRHIPTSQAITACPRCRQDEWVKAKLPASIMPKESDLSPEKHLDFDGVG